VLPSGTLTSPVVLHAEMIGNSATSARECIRIETSKEDAI
jgi:hypothetical protein